MNYVRIHRPVFFIGGKDLTESVLAILVCADKFAGKLLFVIEIIDSDFELGEETTSSSGSQS